MAGTGCRKEAPEKREAKSTAKKHETKSQKQQPQKKGKKPKFSEALLLEALKAVGHPATSREISDKLGVKDPDQGRTMVRTRMKKLIKEGRVKSVEPTDELLVKQLYALP